MKRGPNRHTRAFLALQSAKTEKRKLTLDEAKLIQNSDYSRFSVPGGLLTPEELIEAEYAEMMERN